MSTAHRNHTRVIGLLAILALLVAVLAMTVSAAEADKEVRVEMTIGQTAYTVNGTEKTMDSAPYVNSDDRTMVPLRFLGEAIGAEVSWDAAADTAVNNRHPRPHALPFSLSRISFMPCALPGLPCQPLPPL